MKKTNRQTMSWHSLAKEMGMDYRSLKENCKGIMRRINKISKKPRTLYPAQVKIIKDHLAYTDKED